MLDTFLSEFIQKNPSDSITYRLDLPNTRFMEFVQLYDALVNISGAMTNHYSEVVYTDTDGVEGIYRLEHDPVFQRSIRTKLCTVTCEKKPNVCVTVISSKHEPQVEHDLHYTIKSTQLTEVWTFTVNEILYILKKSSTGTTKQAASIQLPSFSIDILHKNVNTIYDLFQLHTFPPHEPLIVHYISIKN
jgi:hypothetical protein